MKLENKCGEGIAMSVKNGRRWKKGRSKNQLKLGRCEYLGPTNGLESNLQAF